MRSPLQLWQENGGSYSPSWKFNDSRGFYLPTSWGVSFGTPITDSASTCCPSSGGLQNYKGHFNTTPPATFTLNPSGSPFGFNNFICAIYQSLGGSNAFTSY
ncbi:MAG TPA: hypothetical protein VIY86_06515, partial [Pirellulaceae bacterium]